jgi:hypothetical protein
MGCALLDRISSAKENSPMKHLKDINGSSRVVKCPSAIFINLQSDH